MSQSILKYSEILHRIIYRLHKIGLGDCIPIFMILDLRLTILAGYDAKINEKQTPLARFPQ